LWDAMPHSFIASAMCCARWSVSVRWGVMIDGLSTAEAAAELKQLCFQVL